MGGGEKEFVFWILLYRTRVPYHTYLYILRVRYFCVLFGTRYLLFHFGSTMYLILDSYGEYFRIPVLYGTFPVSLSLSGEDVGIGSWE